MDFQRLLPILGILAIAGVLLVAFLRLADFFGKRSRKSLSAWAAENHLEIVEAERRTILCGPFSLTLNVQTVYRLEALDTARDTKRGWALLGLGCGKVLRVIWDT